MKNIIIGLKYLHLLFGKYQSVGSRFSYDRLAESLGNGDKISNEEVIKTLFNEVPPIYIYGEKDSKKYYLLKRHWCITKDLYVLFICGIRHRQFFHYLKDFILDIKKGYYSERYDWYYNPNEKSLAR